MLSGSHIRIRSDNIATMSAVNKSTSRSRALMPYIRCIFWLCVKFDVMLTCVYIPGSENLLSDRISRLNSVPEAMDARLLLSGFSPQLVFCNGHMSLSTFIYLQESWTLALRCL